MPKGNRSNHASGPKNGRWRGGVTWTNGYAWVCHPSPHPRKHKGAVRRATLVLEDKIGRRLATGECAHHLDRDKANDSPDNLALMTTYEHNHAHCRGRASYRRECVVCNAEVTRERFRSAVDRTTCGVVCRNRLISKRRPEDWNRARKTHCVRGHEFTPENTHTSKQGVRRCRKCNVIRSRSYARTHRT